MSADLEAVLGVNLKAGVAFLGEVARPCSPVVDHFLKIPPPTNVDEWERLRQFGDRIVAEARACKAVCVAFAEPRLNQWSYSDARERVSLQTAAGLALRVAGVEVRLVHPKTAASKLGFAGKIKAMDDGLAATLQIDTPNVKYWEARSPAFAVAATIALERWR